MREANRQRALVVVRGFVTLWKIFAIEISKKNHRHFQIFYCLCCCWRKKKAPKEKTGSKGGNKTGKSTPDPDDSENATLVVINTAVSTLRGMELFIMS